MKDFTLAEIAKACNGEYVGDESLKNTKITSVERDSRQVKNGSLFLAIKGERVDGHDFIEKCFAQGAVCALCEKAPENATKPCIVVPSTLDAVKKIGRAYRKIRHSRYRNFGQRRKNFYKRNALCCSFTEVQDPQNTRQSQ